MSLVPVNFRVPTLGYSLHFLYAKYMEIHSLELLWYIYGGGGLKSLFNKEQSRSI